MNSGCKFARSSARRTIVVSVEGPAKPRRGAFVQNKCSACSAGRAISTQVGGQGFAYIRREGHPVVKQPLAPNEDFAGSPIDVL